MEHSPNKNNHIKTHQEGVIAVFPEAAKHLLYTESDLPPGSLIMQRGRSEDLSRDAERQEQLKATLKQIIPSTFETYVSDLRILQKNNPDATLLGVSYDPLEEKITAPPVYMSETFRSTPLLTGSLARQMSVEAKIESDFIASIQKRTIGIDDSGHTEDFYVLELTRQNTTLTDDVYDSWSGVDGEAVLRIGLDCAHDDIFAEVKQGTVNRSTPLESGLEIVMKAFPTTSNA